jgi:hypothetical protein
MVNNIQSHNHKDVGALVAQPQVGKKKNKKRNPNSALISSRKERKREENSLIQL